MQEYTIYTHIYSHTYIYILQKYICRNIPYTHTYIYILHTYIHATISLCAYLYIIICMNYMYSNMCKSLKSSLSALEMTKTKSAKHALQILNFIHFNSEDKA